MAKKPLKRWDVWYADFPYEEDTGRVSQRPVIILSVKPVVILSIKVTTNTSRIGPYEVYLDHWKDANLTKPSTARVSHLANLIEDNFSSKIGTLHPQDAVKVYTAYRTYLDDLEKIKNDCEGSFAKPTSLFSEHNQSDT